MIPLSYSLNLFGGAFKFEIEPQVLPPPPPSLTDDFTSTVYVLVIENDFRLPFLFKLPKNLSRHLS